MIAMFGLNSEAVTAIAVAFVGSVGSFVLARKTAKRQVVRDESDDEFRFRGELRGDNDALRAEIKVLKVERDALYIKISGLDTELWTLKVERRKRQADDEASEARQATADPGDISTEQIDERNIRKAADKATDERQGD